MRICVPLLSSALNKAASNDFQLAAHFGLAERFAIIDSISGDILDECDIAGHCPGPCHCPLPDLDNNGIEVFVGHSMGFRLMQLSRRAKLQVLTVKARTLSELRYEMRNTTQALPLLVARCLTKAGQQTVTTKQ